MQHFINHYMKEYLALKDEIEKTISPTNNIHLLEKAKSDLLN